jgi:hypothetical protein
MAIVAVFQSPTLTQAKYEESVRRVVGLEVLAVAGEVV